MTRRGTKSHLENTMATDLESRDTAMKAEAGHPRKDRLPRAPPLARTETQTSMSFTSHTCSPVLGGFGCLGHEG